MRVRAYVHTCVHLCACAHSFVCLLCMHVHIDLHVCMYEFVCMFVYEHRHVHTRAHACVWWHMSASAWSPRVKLGGFHFSPQRRPVLKVSRQVLEDPLHPAGGVVVCLSIHHS